MPADGYVWIIVKRGKRMESVILGSIITGSFALLGTVLTIRVEAEKTRADIASHESVQDERIKSLTEEVRKHNNFAEQIPRIDQRIISLEKEVYRK